jgi:hypothetical protein
VDARQELDLKMGVAFTRCMLDPEGAAQKIAAGGGDDCAPAQPPVLAAQLRSPIHTVPAGGCTASATVRQQTLRKRIASRGPLDPFSGRKLQSNSTVFEAHFSLDSNELRCPA